MADMVAGKVDGCSWADMAVGGNWFGIDEVVVGCMEVGRLAGSSKAGVGMVDCFVGVRNHWLGKSRLPPLLCLSCKGVSSGWLRWILQLWHKGLGFSLC